MKPRKSSGDKKSARHPFKDKRPPRSVARAAGAGEIVEVRIEGAHGRGGQRAGAPRKSPSAAPRAGPLVLLVDDDRSVTTLVEHALRGCGIELMPAHTVAEGLQCLDQAQPDLMLLDILLPDDSGLELFRQLQLQEAPPPVIFITVSDSSDLVIEAIKLGAVDYLQKPLDVAQVREVVLAALRVRAQAEAPIPLLGPEQDVGHGEQLVGRSLAMQDVYKAIGRVAAQNVTVLIHGESGTGKELVARAIHDHSPRAGGPFMAVNCAAIPETLLESELFGHEKGSFTGADHRRLGKFEQCSGGTLVLDEVGDMSPLAQSKVLRVLQEQRFERVGGNQTVETDVRILASTNRDLRRMVAEGRFRPDLYYRLRGFTIDLPPLRERTEDMCLLVGHFLRRFNAEIGTAICGISPAALELLVKYPWPGNIRELQSVLRQALLRASGSVLVPEFLPEALRPLPLPVPSLRQAPGNDLRGFIDHRLESHSNHIYAESLALTERYVLSRVLEWTSGNKSQTAKILGITRGSLRHKITSLGLSVDEDSANGDGDDDEADV